MTDKKTEALKLARDALEHISSHYMSLPKIGCMALAAVDEAMAEQPAQQRHISYVCPQCYWSLEERPAPVAEPHKQQIASVSVERGEPVAWSTQLGEYAHIQWGAKRPEYPMVYEFPLYTSPPASKPWADECRIELLTAIQVLASDYENALGAFRGDTEARRKAEGDIAHARSIASRWNWNGTTEPASKPWVGLTDEEIHDIYDAVAKQEPYAMAVTRRNIACAIEAKLREKNEHREKNNG